jgi:hypothetical protein
VSLLLLPVSVFHYLVMSVQRMLSSNAGVHSGGSHVSLDSLRDAAKAGNEGSKSQVRKSFYTNVPKECSEDMERSVVKLMGLSSIRQKNTTM